MTPRGTNPVPLSPTAALKNATRRYEDFTGHAGKTIFEYPAPHLNGPHYGALFGRLDELRLGNGQNLVFSGRDRPGLAASHDGKQLFVVNNANSVPKVLDGLKITAVCYTTIRDGKTERYIHHFRPAARPTIKVKGTVILIQGGRFEFTETGINDR